MTDAFHSDSERAAALLANGEAFAIYLYGPERGPLPISFEVAAGRLERLPRLFFEWDGSWVWSGHDDRQQRWQLDGMVYDAAGQVQYVDVKGCCPKSVWRELLGALLPTEPETPPPDSAAHPDDWCALRLPAQQLQPLEVFERETWGEAE